MKNTFTSNYEKVVETWRQKFLLMEQENLIKRFRLDADEDALYIVYFSQKIRIDRKSGELSYVDFPEKKPGFNTSITIYNMFHYALENPIASGKLVPFREVKRVYPFEAAYRQTILSALEVLFTGHVEEMRRGCEKLHGRKMPQGDVGYILPVFPFLEIAVLFWDGDEEFSAQANMLFDSNITDFMHEENVVGVAADAVHYLGIAAGMSPGEIYAG